MPQGTPMASPVADCMMYQVPSRRNCIECAARRTNQGPRAHGPPNSRVPRGASEVGTIEAAGTLCAFCEIVRSNHKGVREWASSNE